MPVFNPNPSIPPLASKLVAFGHSYLQAGGTTHADRQYFTLLSGMLRTDGTDRGVGGALAALDQNWLGAATNWGGWAWVLQTLQPYRGSAPYTAPQMTPLLHFGINDVQRHAHDVSGVPRTIFKTAIRTMMSRCCTARLFEDTDSTIAYGGSGGTWQPAKLDSFKNSGTQYRPIPGNGATTTITLPSDVETGYATLGYTVWPASDGQITISGTAANATGTFSLAGLAYATGGTGAARDSSNGHVIRIPITSADASKTIIATYSAGGGTAFATPTAYGTITQAGVAGSTSYSYQRYYLTYNGFTLGATTTTALGNATLTTSNYNIIPAGSAWPSGVEAEYVVRSAGGTVQGVIAVLTTGPAIVNDQNNASSLSGSGYTIPTNSANPLTGGAAFDYWQLEAGNPATSGYIVGLNRLLPAAYINSAADADITNYNTDIKSVIAEFPSGTWTFVDIDSAIGASTTYLYTDGVHPNDRGYAKIAEAIYTAMETQQSGQTAYTTALQSRVTKRITARNLIMLQYGGYTTNKALTTQDYALSTSWADIDATNLWVGIEAQIGDDIEVVLSAMCNNVASNSQFDVCTTDVSGNPVTYFSANPVSPTVVGTLGWPAWFTSTSITSVAPVSGSAVYTVQARDIVTANSVPGQVMLKLRGKTASTRTLYGGGTVASPPLIFHVKNLGQRNTPGFNAS